MNKKGFSLVEIMLYTAILAIMSGLFAGILNTTTRIQLQEVSASEVSNQLNFAMQTIQRHIRASVNIEAVGADNLETANTVELAYIKLRMQSPNEDPVCISQVANAIRISIGALEINPLNKNCKDTDSTNDITTAKISVPTAPLGLSFIKFSNYPGHDLVQVDLAFDSANPVAPATRKITSAISRVSAASFDSSLIPGSTASYDLGQNSSRWKNGYFSGALNITGTVFAENDINVANDAVIKRFLTVTDYFRFEKSGAGAPAVTDCDHNPTSERGRLYLDTTSNRLYICNNAPRNWDYINLTN